MKKHHLFLFSILLLSVIFNFSCETPVIITKTTIPGESTLKITEKNETPVPTSVYLDSSGLENKDNPINLLFVWGTNCPHSNYQKPVITAFEKNHPEVKVTWVNSDDLNLDQQLLTAGTTGTPVMVFYNQEFSRQIVGETTLEALESELLLFINQISERNVPKSTGGSQST